MRSLTFISSLVPCCTDPGTVHEHFYASLVSGSTVGVRVVDMFAQVCGISWAHVSLTIAKVIWGRVTLTILDRCSWPFAKPTGSLAIADRQRSDCWPWTVQVVEDAARHCGN